MLKKQDGNLDFSQTAEELARKVRAFSPWPGTFTQWQGKSLIIHAAHAVPGKSKESGKRTIIDNLPGIYTSDGILILEELQPAGKKKMTGQVFLNGARGWEE
jgi:methionyl-tRNA formyltransferase